MPGRARALSIASAISCALAAVLWPSRAAEARCEIAPGQVVEARGWIVDAWLDRRGNPIYVLDADPPSCDGEITFVRGPSAALECRGGQQAIVSGRYEPVTFDFTGSGYFIRADRLSCR